MDSTLLKSIGVEEISNPDMKIIDGGKNVWVEVALWIVDHLGSVDDFKEGYQDAKDYQDSRT